MTLEEITIIVSLVEAKLNEVKEILADMNICKNEKSKTLLLAAAGKLASQFSGIQLKQ